MLPPSATFGSASHASEAQWHRTLAARALLPPITASTASTASTHYELCTCCYCCHACAAYVDLAFKSKITHLWKLQDRRIQQTTAIRRATTRACSATRVCSVYGSQQMFWQRRALSRHRMRCWFARTWTFWTCLCFMNWSCASWRCDSNNKCVL